MGNAKLFVEEKEDKVLKSSSPYFLQGRLGLYELGIPKRRKSSCKQAVRPFAAMTTGQDWHKNLTDCNRAWISLQKKEKDGVR